ncbi:BofC C-terminal domain-containing protein [Ammoniphilus sp. YIM 78166]|uniref:BofC C-terminal domain-containing protein n=1 Tax=Ammoniphilus sp. YIM 78166 TaxID=1644106 RepID=UPI00106FBBE8|nr:BofC C-terminal domain-containing protein [Ammoniphilus sp. YIM 78166]
MWNRRTNRSQSFFYGFFSAVLLILIAGGAWLTTNTIEEQKRTLNPDREQQVETVQAPVRQEVELVLTRAYICGAETEEKVTQVFSSLNEVYMEYKDWELVSNDGNQFAFKKLVPDLSPVCKENGFFGLNQDNMLTLYEGPPEDEKVIQTFFHIDTKKLASSLFERDLLLLQQGIRIHDLGEYNSILSTYGEFSDHSEYSRLTDVEHLED